MKSVIAQGATISKAIDEALNKAGQPQEFFIKILEEGQVGFLGFGSKKAKIALFFKKDDYPKRDSEVLSQGAYRDLFNNDALHKQAISQQKDQQQDQQDKKDQKIENNKQVHKQKFQEERRFQRRQLGTDAIKQHNKPVLSDKNIKVETPVKHEIKKTEHLVQKKTSEQQIKDDGGKPEQQNMQQRSRRRFSRRRRSGSSEWSTNQDNAKKTDKPNDSK